MKKMRKGLLIYLISTLVVCGSYEPACSQKNGPVSPKEGLYEILIARDFELKDFAEMKVSSSHINNNGVRFTYYTQYFEGIPVDGANITQVEKEGELFVPRIGFHKRITEKIQRKNGPISPESALRKAVNHLKFPFSGFDFQKAKTSDFTFFDPLLSKSPVETQLSWTELQGMLVLCWKLLIDSPYSADIWELHVNASDGSLVKSYNQTIYCDYERSPGLSPSISDVKASRGSIGIQPKSQQNVDDGSSYQVYPVPVESPFFGTQTVVNQPADSVASPFGWHDIDGIVGPEFTFTRGNNVHAFQDRDDNGISSGDEPDGGESLSFLFEHDLEGTTQDNLNADVTNLFYWNNVVHDWSYRFGFDEAAGNFQQNNYGKGGAENDYVVAHALDGGNTNNASFSTPSDGSRGRMQLFPWRSGVNSLSITSPASIALEFTVGTADFGPLIEIALEGEVFLINDGDSILTDGCEPIVNSDEISGNVALVDRGNCFFYEKVLSAEAAGASACIVCNNVSNEGAINMGSPNNADPVLIPSVMISKEDCDLLKAELVQGNKIEVRLNPIQFLSSSFDNGVVIHEYSHGISSRLSGGAANSNCLNNEEEMGEGWSDFFALVMTHQEGDNGNDSRSLGSYLVDQSGSGGGIRRYPYSRDMSINPQIHSHIRRTQTEHALGEVWAVTLWDMYWAFVDQDGFDPSWENPLSGNFKAVQLVIDGLKGQPCNPGILEARDAILLADLLNYDGDNKCLIWQAFARRGLGFDATDGSSHNRTDNTDGFATTPECIAELKISKEVESSVNVGEELKTSIEVINHTSNVVRNVVVTDELPPGTRIIDGSSSHSFVIQNSTMVFALGDMIEDQAIEIEYQLSTDEVLHSEFVVFDNFEGALGFDRTESPQSLPGWNLITSDSEGGVFSFRVRGDTLEGRSLFTMKDAILIDGLSPTLKFWHRFKTQTGIDGGIIEYSTDGGGSWASIAPDMFIVNGYSDYISRDFLYQDTEPAFTGIRDWHESQVDLSEFIGVELLLRFVYIHQQYAESTSSEGWLVDNFEIYDRQELTGRTCVQSEDTPETCVIFLTTVSSVARTVPTQDLVNEIDLVIFPNPTKEKAIVHINDQVSGDYLLRVFAPNGREIMRRKGYKGKQKQTIELVLTAQTPGLFLIELEYGGRTTVQKIVLQ